MKINKKHQAPCFLRWVVCKILNEKNINVLINDFDIYFEHLAESKGLIKAIVWYIKQILIMIPGRIKTHYVGGQSW